MSLLFSEYCNLPLSWKTPLTWWTAYEGSDVVDLQFNRTNKISNEREYLISLLLIFFSLNNRPNNTILYLYSFIHFNGQWMGLLACVRCN